jgi:hypothetical protein
MWPERDAATRLLSSDCSISENYNVPPGRAPHPGERRTFAKTTPKLQLLCNTTVYHSIAQCYKILKFNLESFLRLSYKFAHCAQPHHSSHSVLKTEYYHSCASSFLPSFHHYERLTPFEQLIVPLHHMLRTLPAESAFFCMIYDVWLPHWLLEAQRPVCGSRPVNASSSLRVW